jgi:hypothetical protein
MLPKFRSIVRHCERPFRRRFLPPLNPDGTYPRWFTAIRPDYALRQWITNRPLKPQTQESE